MFGVRLPWLGQPERRRALAHTPAAGDLAKRIEQPPVVEPVHPGEGGKLNGLGATPTTVFADEFRLVQADDRLGARVVTGAELGLIWRGSRSCGWLADATARSLLGRSFPHPSRRHE